MRIPQIAAPMFILRQQCGKDLFAVLEKIHALGFDGVEFLGFFGHMPVDIRRKLDQLSLSALGNHVDYLQFSNHVPETIAAHKTLGCSYITIGGPPQNMLANKEFMQTYFNDLIRIGNSCRQHGLILLYHNHAFELFTQIDNTPLLNLILNNVASESMSFEPDLGWIAIGGGSPESYLDQYRRRCPVIHLKDFYAENPQQIGDISILGEKRGGPEHSYFEFRPTGYGIVNTPALMDKVKACNPAWLVADHDLAYERDPYADLKLSLDYLKSLLALQDKRNN